MHRKRLYKTLLAGLLSLMVLGVNARPALALPGSQKTSTRIVIDTPVSVEIGKLFTLTGTFIATDGTGLSNRPILFNINGEYLGQTRTDQNGRFSQVFSRPLETGIYDILAYANETVNFLGSSSFTKLEILPANFKIETIPPIQGIQFEAGGAVYTSGVDGTVDVKFPRAGHYEIKVLTEQISTPEQIIEFDRWRIDTFTTSTFAEIPKDTGMSIGFITYRKIGQTFVDLDGYPVSTQRISEYSIKSIQGDFFTLKDGSPIWIPSSRIARRPGGLDATELVYSVVNVMIDGSNVVNQSQQQFAATTSDTWKITLILYSLSVQARDKLFGAKLSKSIDLVFPDGQVKNYPLDENGMVTIHGLARGNYTVEVLGTNGLKQVQPVVLSKDQNIQLNIVTLVDIVFVGAVALIFAVGLVLLGRPRILQGLLRRIPPKLPEVLPTNVSMSKQSGISEKKNVPRKSSP